MGNQRPHPERNVVALSPGLEREWGQCADR
jgi:hypothetical protein